MVCSIATNSLCPAYSIQHDASYHHVITTTCVVKLQYNQYIVCVARSQEKVELVVSDEVVDTVGLRLK